MSANLFPAPTSNFLSTSLNGAINDSVTTITLNSVTGLPTSGYIIIDRQNSSNVATPNAREVVSYTGISGSDLTGCTRGADNSTARSHSSGALVETMPTVGMWNDQRTALLNVLNTAGALDTTKVLDLSTLQTASNKILSSPTIATPYINAGHYSSPTIITPSIQLANTTVSTADGSLVFDRTNEDFLIGDGTNTQYVHMGAWKDWVPTWTNLTKGSATITAKYTQVGKLVYFRLDVVFAANTTIGGVVAFTLPVTSVSYGGTASTQPIGQSVFVDTGTAYYYGALVWSSTTTASPRVNVSDALYLKGDAMQATVPMTWANTDEYHCFGCYEAA